MKQIILASTSPRRRELMKKLGLPFRAIETPFEEDMSLPLPPAKLVQHLALGKAEAVAHRYTTRAGAYAVQDIGAQFIRRIDGDLSNAIGLPLPRIRTELAKVGIRAKE